MSDTHRIYINRAHVFDEGVTWTTAAGMYPHAYVPEEAYLAALARAEAAEATIADLEQRNAQLLRDLSQLFAQTEAAEAEVAASFEAGLTEALKVISSIGYGASEDVDRGHEEAYRAVEKYLADWKASAALASGSGPMTDRPITFTVRKGNIDKDPTDG